MHMDQRVEKGRILDKGKNVVEYNISTKKVVISSEVLERT